MDYDVVILGGGLIGCSIAYELSKYNLNIALIEKNYDIAHDISHINTSIVYSGAESNNSLVSELESIGNDMLDVLVSKFNVPFKRTGTLYVARNEEEEKIIEEIYNRAIDRGIKDVKLLDKEYVYAMEPNFKKDINKALYIKKTGVICPFDLALAYAEIAFVNDVNFKLEEEVLDIKKSAQGFQVITSKNKFKCKLVINTLNNFSYTIDKWENSKPKKEELKFFLFDSKFDNKFSNIIFSIDEKKDKAFIIPANNNKTIGAIKTKNNIYNLELLEKFSKLMDGIKFKDVKSFYESMYYKDEILIDDSSIDNGYIKIRGKHYGLVTMTPAIANIVCETVRSNFNCKLKKEFIDKRREYFKFSELTDDERETIIEADKRYGKMICLCNYITEGEIIDSIRRPLGARTVEGVKRRTGASFGNCYGAQCLNKIVDILARETNKKITDIVKDSKNSKIILSRIKEFEEV